MAKFRFPCPHCQTRLSALPEHTGKTAKCSACGEKVTVPAAPKKKAAKRDDASLAAGLLAEEESFQRPFVSQRDRTKHDELDMTPMVDVTFLLLIFFMVTASFNIQKAIQVPPPEMEEAATEVREVEDVLDDAEYVVVYVDADNTYRVSASFWDDEQDAPSEQQMRIKLQQARRGPPSGGRPPTKLMVMASPDARHDKVVTALDAGNMVGMDEIKLTTLDDAF